MSFLVLSLEDSCSLGGTQQGVTSSNDRQASGVGGSSCISQQLGPYFMSMQDMRDKLIILIWENLIKNF
jgi:hypothetical protein